MHICVTGTRVSTLARVIGVTLSGVVKFSLSSDFLFSSSLRAFVVSVMPKSSRGGTQGTRSRSHGRHGTRRFQSSAVTTPGPSSPSVGSTLVGQSASLGQQLPLSSQSSKTVGDLSISELLELIHAKVRHLFAISPSLSPAVRDGSVPVMTRMQLAAISGECVC